MKKHAEKCAYKKRRAEFISKKGDVDFVYSPLDCDCDGYHTFSELYEHRIELWIKLCETTTNDCGCCSGIGFIEAWRTKYHSDGELAFGGNWFVLGIGKNKGEQITYHLPIEKWDDCDFAETLEKAPEFDGHTSDDVLDRLKLL